MSRLYRLRVIPPILLLLGPAIPAFAPAQGRPQPVIVDAVRRETVVDRRSVPGEIRALRASRVAAQEAGLVTSLLAREGDAVAEGAPIARLDGERLEIELDVVTAGGELARATLAEREAALDQTVRDLAALRRLAEKNAANPKELADAETTRRAAEARVRQAQAAVRENVRRADLLRHRLADMTINAPFACTVVARHKEVGEWVAVGEAVCDVVSAGPVEAWLEVPQRFLAAVRMNRDPVSVELEATDVVFESNDRRIVPSIDVRARVFPLVVRLENARESFTPGMSISAWVPTGQRVPRLTCDKDAVVRGEAGPFVYVVRGGGDGQPAVAVPVKVEVLFHVGDRVVVDAAALKAGDPVVVEGNERLFPMTPVVPRPRAAADGAKPDPTGAKGAGTGKASDR